MTLSSMFLTLPVMAKNLWKEQLVFIEAFLGVRLEDVVLDAQTDRVLARHDARSSGRAHPGAVVAIQDEPLLGVLVDVGCFHVVVGEGVADVSVPLIVHDHVQDVRFGTGSKDKQGTQKKDGTHVVPSCTRLTPKPSLTSAIYFRKFR